MARNLFLVTHAQSQHHVQGIVGGWHDMALTDLGRRQATALAERLAVLVGDAPVEVWSSDLKRAAETAAAIAARLGLEVQIDRDLREKSLGVAEGRPGAWLEGRVSSARNNIERLDHQDGIEGAESRRAVLTRTERVMEKILKSPCETQIAVTHGFAVTFLIAAWFALPAEACGWIGFRPGPGGITHLQQDDRFFDRALLVFNDRAHLGGL
ncbi:MAG TPA: histidine phosphatase family protein [Caulobacteraceae bacterium]